MKINDGIADWFRICVMAAVMCAGLFGIGHCSNEDFKERQQWAEENPVEAAKKDCVSKVRGSRPACWTEGDWIEFCKHVECKQQ
jgi:hypothetical protein